MRPLDGHPLSSEIQRLLGSSAADAVREAIAGARASEAPPSDAAIRFAEGALLLREGSLVDASVTLREAADRFGRSGETEASELALLEAHVAEIRRGIRDLASAARESAALLVTGGSSPRVRCAALVVRGTAERVLGEAAAAHRSFLEAKEEADAFPELKTQALNSLGTLYVVTGALGAARSLLEPSAELCRARGDVIGEAIAMGQLGAASLALGELPLARRQLSRQEWLARSVGDAFGQARALVWLAEVALELGALDDAVEIAARARTVAAGAGLGTFQAYADRVAGRATQAAGGDGRALSERALSVFSEQRLPLGQALASWDLAVAASPIDRELAGRALDGLASLGLVDRVVDLLSDLDESAELVLMAAAMSPRKAEEIEAALVREEPEALARSVGIRTAARRNLARLSALALRPPGLVLAAMTLAEPLRALAAQAFAGTLGGSLDALCLFVWSDDVDPARVAADLTFCASIGAAGCALALAPEGRVEAPGFGGGTGARLSGVHALGLASVALDASRGPADAIALASGFEPPSAKSSALGAALSNAGLAVVQTSG